MEGDGGVFMGFSRFLVAIGSVFLLFMVATNHASAGPIATPSNGCYVVAYSSMELYGLTTSIDDGMTVIGIELTIESNCGGSIEVRSNVFETNRTFNSGLLIMEMPNGFGNLTVEGQDWEITWNNVSFMSYGSFYQGIINDYKGTLPQPVDINEDELAFRELSASISTLVLAWFGSVMVVDKLARYWVDRYLIEEVV